MKLRILLAIISMLLSLYVRAQNSYPATGAATINGIYLKNGDIVLQNPTSGYPILWLKDVSGTNTVRYDYNSLSSSGGKFFIRTSGANSLVLNDTGGGYVGVGMDSPTELLQVGTTSQRNVNIRLGETASMGVTYQNSETILANNGKVNGIYVKPIKAQQGASAIALNWYYGIRFYTTGGQVTVNDTINKPAWEKFRISPNNGVFAEEVTVKLQKFWPDYVFSSQYKLPKLAEIETYIRKNNHLPEMPSACEVEQDGIKLGEMNTLLVKKTEELTLYLIEQNKLIEQILKENASLKTRLESIEARVKKN